MLELIHCAPETAALLVALPLLAFFVVKWLFQKDQALEDRRRAAGLLASKLTSLGLVRTPKILTDYSVGDYAGLVADFESILDLFLDGEDAVLKEFSGTFSNVLNSEINTPDGLALVQAAIAKVTTPAAK